MEDTGAKGVRLVNLTNVSDMELYRDSYTGEINVNLYCGDEGAGRFSLADWDEVEKLINTLPAIDNLGWILIRDGKVTSWKGSLAVKEVKELTEEEEKAVLSDGPVEMDNPSTWEGSWRG